MHDRVTCCTTLVRICNLGSLHVVQYARSFRQRQSGLLAIGVVKAGRRNVEGRIVRMGVDDGAVDRVTVGRYINLILQDIGWPNKIDFMRTIVGRVFFE